MSKQPSASQVARAERMRIAEKEGAEARALVAANDVAIRKNMERLKVLRLAKEAEDAAQAALAPAEPAPKRKPSVKKQALAET
jgi:hypothetical protein